MAEEHNIPKVYDPTSVEKNGINIGKNTVISMLR